MLVWYQWNSRDGALSQVGRRGGRYYIGAGADLDAQQGKESITVCDVLVCGFPRFATLSLAIGLITLLQSNVTLEFWVLPCRGNRKRKKTECNQNRAFHESENNGWRKIFWDELIDSVEDHVQVCSDRTFLSSSHPPKCFEWDRTATPINQPHNNTSDILDSSLLNT